MKYGFIVTVGTTLMRNYIKWYIDNSLGDENKAMARFQNKQFEKEYIEHIIDCLKSEPPVYPSAEMQTIGLFFKEDGPEEQYKDCSKMLSLLPVKKQESVICAELMKLLLTNQSIAFPLMGTVADIEQKEAINFQFDKKRQFSLQIGSLIAQISDISEQYRQANCERIVICISSGYKAIIPYITLFGFIDGAEVVYAHISSESVVSVSSLPLSWDLRLLDEQRIWAMIDTIPDTLYGSLPPKFKVLHESEPIKKNGKRFYQKNAFGQLVSYAYRRDRRLRFGWGETFLLNIPDDHKNLRESITNLIKTKWEHLWIGDQIPETVEHTRSHSCRLIELARDLFRLTGLNLSGPELYCLVAAIWLHDIGHTALISDTLNDSNCEDNFPLYLFPSLVRQFHNVLSAEMIESEQDLDSDLKPVVVTMSTYHRNKMPLYEEQKSFEEKPFPITIKPLANLDSANIKLELNRVMLLTAILRFLDGCDVQADRIIDRDYREAREKRTSSEIKIYSNRLNKLIQNFSKKDPFYDELVRYKNKMDQHLTDWKKGEPNKSKRKLFQQQVQKKAYEVYCSGNNPSYLEILGLMDSTIFKSEQEAHFLKHCGIECIYLGGSDIKDCVKQNKVKPVIGVYILVKEPIKDNHELVGRLYNVAEDIWEEYSAVKDILDNHFLVTGIYLTDGTNMKVLIPH